MKLHSGSQRALVLCATQRSVEEQTTPACSTHSSPAAHRSLRGTGTTSRAISGRLLPPSDGGSERGEEGWRVGGTEGIKNEAAAGFFLNFVSRSALLRKFFSIMERRTGRTQEGFINKPPAGVQILTHWGAGGEFDGGSAPHKGAVSLMNDC